MAPSEGSDLPEMDIKPEIKEEDPDDGCVPEVIAVRAVRKSRAVTDDVEPRIKSEEPGQMTIDLTYDPFDTAQDSSELSELEGFDDNFDDSQGTMETRNGIQYFVCKTFEIPQICPPVVVMRYVSDLFACLEYGSIVLDSEYQRDSVWDEHQASMLICSILMGYFIPPIIFNHKMFRREDHNGDLAHMINQRICVDGKQRLSALQKFMSGYIGIEDKNQRKWYFCHPMVGSQEILSNHDIIPIAIKDFFKKRTLCCYEYSDLPQETQENMFQLVQRGITLTPTEQMRGKSTEWAVLAKQYEEDYSIVVNLSKQKQASGFRIVVIMFAMIRDVMGLGSTRSIGISSCPILQANPQALERLLEDKAPISPALKLKLKEVFDKFETLVRLCSNQLTATRYIIKKNSVFDPAPDFLEDKQPHTFSPLELVGTAILVAYHMAKHSDEELLRGVKELRHHLRIIPKNLKLDTQCWHSVWEFIRTFPASNPRPSPEDNAQGEERDLTDEDLTTRIGDIVGDLGKRTTRSQIWEAKRLGKQSNRERRSRGNSSVDGISKSLSIDDDTSRPVSETQIEYNRPVPLLSEEGSAGSTLDDVEMADIDNSASSECRTETLDAFSAPKKEPNLDRPLPSDVQNFRANDIRTDVGVSPEPVPYANIPIIGSKSQTTTINKSDSEGSSPDDSDTKADSKLTHNAVQSQHRYTTYDGSPAYSTGTCVLGDLIEDAQTTTSPRPHRHQKDGKFYIFANRNEIQSEGGKNKDELSMSQSNGKKATKSVNLESVPAPLLIPAAQVYEGSPSRYNSEAVPKFRHKQKSNTEKKKRNDNVVTNKAYLDDLSAHDSTGSQAQQIGNESVADTVSNELAVSQSASLTAEFFTISGDPESLTVVVPAARPKEKKEKKSINGYHDVIISEKSSSSKLAQGPPASHISDATSAFMPTHPTKPISAPTEMISAAARAGTHDPLVTDLLKIVDDAPKPQSRFKPKIPLRKDKGPDIDGAIIDGRSFDNEPTLRAAAQIPIPPSAMSQNSSLVTTPSVVPSKSTVATTRSSDETGDVRVHNQPQAELIEQQIYYPHIDCMPHRTYPISQHFASQKNLLQHLEGKRCNALATDIQNPQVADSSSTRKIHDRARKFEVLGTFLSGRGSGTRSAGTSISHTTVSKPSEPHSPQPTSVLANTAHGVSSAKPVATATIGRLLNNADSMPRTECSLKPKVPSVREQNSKAATAASSGRNLSTNPTTHLTNTQNLALESSVASKFKSTAGVSTKSVPPAVSIGLEAITTADDVLKLDDDKPKPVSRFKPKVPLNTERKPPIPQLPRGPRADLKTVNRHSFAPPRPAFSFSSNKRGLGNSPPPDLRLPKRPALITATLASSSRPEQEPDSWSKMITLNRSSPAPQNEPSLPHLFGNHSVDDQSLEYSFVHRPRESPGAHKRVHPRADRGGFSNPSRRDIRFGTRPEPRRDTRIDKTFSFQSDHGPLESELMQDIRAERNIHRSFQHGRHEKQRADRGDTRPEKNIPSLSQYDTQKGKMSAQRRETHAHASSQLPSQYSRLEREQSNQTDDSRRNGGIANPLQQSPQEALRDDARDNGQADWASRNPFHRHSQRRQNAGQNQREVQQDRSGVNIFRSHQRGGSRFGATAPGQIDSYRPGPVKRPYGDSNLGVREAWQKRQKPDDA